MARNVLIVYHYIAHYRRPIFSLLSKSDAPVYTILAGDKPDIEIELVEGSLNKVPPENGGLRWLKVSNWWFLKYFLIQPALFKPSLYRDYDTVIFLGNMYFISTWIGIVLAKHNRCKVLFWTHGFIKDEKGLKGRLRATFYRMADEILVYGSRAKELLIQRGFRADKVKLIYNSLDYDQQIEVIENNTIRIQNLGFENEQLPVFGYIGRLTPQKKIDWLIKGLHKLHNDGIKANCLIIGSGIVQSDLQALAKELGMENNVIFYGACYDEATIYALLSKLNVVVSPGEVGLTCIHSLTYGVPVLTHNLFSKQMPEYEAIIDGRSGGFYEYDNFNDFCVKLQWWLLNNNKGEASYECKRIISEKYNPYVQLEIFNSCV